MAGLGHKISRSRITITRNRMARQDQNKNEHAFEGG